MQISNQTGAYFQNEQQWKVREKVTVEAPEQLSPTRLGQPRIIIWHGATAQC
nr:hypothetical protein [Klebsiella pneumoniae]